MSCLQFSIQSMMPSLLGYPSDDMILQCSNYGSTGGAYSGQPNGLRSQFSDTVVPADEITSDNWLQHLNITMNGTNSVVLRPISPDDQAAQNLGVTFLPWNQRPYERTTWGTNSENGTPYPFNPWNRQTIMSNGMTVAKIAGIGLVVFMTSKLIYKMTIKRKN